MQALVCGPMQRCMEACFTGAETSLQVDKACFIEGARTLAKMRKRSSTRFVLEHTKWKLIQEKQ
jgi:hypothetical protein